MPRKMPSPCRHAGCPKTSETGWCDEHRKVADAADRARRGTASQRGYNSRWRAARKTYLAHHPLCVTCQASGRTEAATVVDHITPHKGDKQLFWDSGNWQALCKRCHDRKTATQDR